MGDGSGDIIVSEQHIRDFQQRQEAHGVRRNEHAARLRQLQSSEDYFQGDMLPRLWRVFHNTECPGLKAEEWKKLGFQQADVTGDLDRGSKALALRHFVAAAEGYPGVLKAMVQRQQTNELQWYLPIAAMACNLSHMITEEIDLCDEEAPQSLKEPLKGGGGASVPVKELPFCEEPGWDTELFMILLLVIDWLWARDNVGYMDFSRHFLPRVRSLLRDVISSRPVSMRHLRLSLFSCAEVTAKTPEEFLNVMLQAEREWRPRQWVPGDPEGGFEEAEDASCLTATM